MKIDSSTTLRTIYTTNAHVESHIYSDDIESPMKVHTVTPNEVMYYELDSSSHYKCYDEVDTIGEQKDPVVRDPKNIRPETTCYVDASTVAAEVNGYNAIYGLWDDSSTVELTYRQKMRY